jgi:hypothetical protein
MTVRHSLRTHLLSLYVLLALLSGIIVPMISMRITMAEFKGYLRERKKYDIDELADALISLYQEEDGWDERRVRDVLRQASRIPMMALALYDTAGRRLFPLRGGEPRHYMMPEAGDLPKEIPSGKGTSKSGTSGSGTLRGGVGRIPLKSDGKDIGTLIVALPPLPGKGELMFVKRLARYAVVGAVFMVVLACALGFIVAGGLSRPVLRAAAPARRITPGE